MRLTALTASLALTATVSAAADVIETDQMVVYEGQWVQSKIPEQNGALMFLTVPRGQNGEYFTISCVKKGDQMDRDVRLGFPEPVAGKDEAPVSFVIDGQTHAAMAKPVGTTPDPTFTKSDIHRYEVVFDDDAKESGFLGAMKAGNELTIAGQTIPVDLKGFTAALNGQAKYCK